jgi:lipopolysaccharide heptosyltransferase II
MSQSPEKILLIRFSSFGDVVQTLSVVSALKKRWPEAEIHWVTRSEFSPLIETHLALHKVWGLEKNKGLKGLWTLAMALRGQNFTRIYDAHNNLRSHFIGWVLRIPHGLAQFQRPQLLRRSIRRWKRFLLFNLRINLFEQPFSGQRDLLEPLESWGIANTPPSAPQLFVSSQSRSIVHQLLQRRGLSTGPFVALAASAAFPLKRWPLDHWKQLLQLWLTTDSQIKFVLLGGPEDHFLKELSAIDENRIVNLAGQLSLAESAAIVERSSLLIANDTGLLHVGEQLGKTTLALMGPAPFGFPCRRESTHILELDLECRPCSKHGQGPCRNARYQWCLVGISPEHVLETAQSKLLLSSKTVPHEV